MLSAASASAVVPTTEKEIDAVVAVTTCSAQAMQALEWCTEHGMRGDLSMIVCGSGADGRGDGDVGGEGGLERGREGGAHGRGPHADVERLARPRRDDDLKREHLRRRRLVLAQPSQLVLGHLAPWAGGASGGRLERGRGRARLLQMGSA